MNKSHLELLGGSALVALIVIGVYYLAPKGPAIPAPAQILREAVPQPEYSAEIAVALERSKGFQHVISYTGDGFEPSTLRLAQGETVRFVNNSLDLLWVASTGSGGQIYPGQSECGQSSFDSCVTIGPGVFWEFTFNEAGTWTYKNNANVSEIGSVTVITE